MDVPGRLKGLLPSLVLSRCHRLLHELPVERRVPLRQEGVKSHRAVASLAPLTTPDSSLAVEHPPIRTSERRQSGTLLLYLRFPLLMGRAERASELITTTIPKEFCLMRRKRRKNRLNILFLDSHNNNRNNYGVISMHKLYH